MLRAVAFAERKKKFSSFLPGDGKSEEVKQKFQNEIFQSCNGMKGFITKDLPPPSFACIQVFGVPNWAGGHVMQAVKAGRTFGDYHRLLTPAGRYEVIANMPGYKPKSTRIWLEKTPTTLDFVLDPEVTLKGNGRRTGFEWDCGYKSRLEFMSSLWGYPPVIFLILIVPVVFVCTLLRRRMNTNPSKRRNIGVTKSLGA